MELISEVDGLQNFNFLLGKVPEIQQELISRNVWVWWVCLVLPGVALLQILRHRNFPYGVTSMFQHLSQCIFQMWSLWMVFTSSSSSCLKIGWDVSLAIYSQSKRSNSDGSVIPSLSNIPLSGLNCPGLPSIESSLERPLHSSLQQAPGEMSPALWFQWCLV